VLESSVVDDSLPVPRWWTRRRRSLAWLLAVGAACVAGIVVVHRLTVLTVPGRLFDDAALRGAAVGSSVAGDSVEAVLDVVTVTSMVAAVALVAVIALFRMRRVLGLAAVALLVLANVLSRLLKAYLLNRPDLGLDESAPATLNSMPSGHTTAAFSIAAALLIVVPVGLRMLTAGVGIALTTTVAISTMAAGWHRVGDSLASYLLVTACAAGIGIVVLLADPQLRDHPGGQAAPSDPPAVRPVRRLALAGLAVLLLAAPLVAALAASATVRDSWLGPPAAFVAGSLLMGGGAVVATALVMGVAARIAAPDPVGDPVAPPGAGPIVAATEPPPDGPEPAAGPGT
jgi:membrane-associated phospholipid phosphatase